MAKFPSVATSFGWISSIWRKRCGSQEPISSGCGSRFWGAEALQDVRDVDVGALEADAGEQPASSSSPAWPTKGIRSGPRGSRAPCRRRAGRRRGCRPEDDLRARRRESTAGAAGSLVGVGRRPAARSGASLIEGSGGRRADANICAHDGARGGSWLHLSLWGSELMGVPEPAPAAAEEDTCSAGQGSTPPRTCPGAARRRATQVMSALYPDAYAGSS